MITTGQMSGRSRPSSKVCAFALLALAGGCNQAGVQTSTGSGGAVGGGTGGSAAGSGGSASSGGSSGASDAGTGGSIGPTSDGSVAPTSDANCGLSTFALERLPPDVLITLDRSASMDQFILDLRCITQCATKWSDMTTALNATVAKTQAAVNWGLKLFPSDASCGVTDDVSAPVAPNNADAVLGAIMASKPDGNTPTRLALEAGGRYLMGLTRPNPRYVVLATDGLPNCAGAAQGDDATATIMAVKNLATANIPVFVIGVGSFGSGDGTLNAMAQAGGKPRAGNPSYYPVSNADDLSAALAAIGGQIVSCTLPIKQPPDPTNIAVDADGMRVPRNDTNGWAYGAGMTTIELRGTWCTNYQNGSLKNIKAIFGCPGVIIP
jgi:von Willebrand factor type A domain